MSASLRNETFGSLSHRWIDSKTVSGRRADSRTSRDGPSRSVESTRFRPICIQKSQGMEWPHHGNILIKHACNKMKPCNGDQLKLLHGYTSWIQAEFITKCKLIKERMESRESETLGKWMTEETLKKTGKYSASQVKSILSYCRKFPGSLVRLDIGMVHASYIQHMHV